MNNQNWTNRSSDDSPTMPDPLLEWSRGYLDLSEDSADHRDLRLLLRLSSQGFLPRPAEEAALCVLWRNQPEEVSRAAVDALRQDRHRMMKSQIDGFERLYFQLPLEHRRRNWEKLFRSCQSLPLLLHRLQRLESGLDAERGISHPELMSPGSIGDVFQRMFLADRKSLTSIRDWFLDRESAHPNDHLEALARELKEHHPKIASLQPDFLEELLSLNARKRVRVLERNRRRTSILRTQELSLGQTAFVILLIAAVVFVVIAVHEKKWPQHRPAVYTAPRLTEESMLGLMANPGEQLLDVARRQAQNNPDDLDYQHVYAKQLLNSAIAVLGNINHVASIHFNTPEERETFYLEACEVMQPLMIKAPGNTGYAATFFEACRHYQQHPRDENSVGRAANLSPPDIAELPSLRQRYFSQLVTTHLGRARYPEAMATLHAQRELSRGNVRALMGIAYQFAQIAWPPSGEVASPDSPQRDPVAPESTKPDRELRDAAATEFFVTVASAWRECLARMQVPKEPA